MDDIVKINKVILFVDLHNYSIVTIRLGDRAPEFTQAYYVLSGNAVVDHGGTLIKYIGDAVLAVFDEGEELNAVKAALETRERFAELSNSMGVGDITEIEAGIGSGEVAFGTFGHSSLLVTDLCGEPVSEVAMIMHHRGVAVTKEVHAAISSTMECNALPGRQLKWREEPLEQWEVIGPL
jgi:adenylate cyclase